MKTKFLILIIMSVYGAMQLLITVLLVAAVVIASNSRVQYAPDPRDEAGISYPMARVAPDAQAYIKWAGKRSPAKTTGQYDIETNGFEGAIPANNNDIYDIAGNAWERCNVLHLPNDYQLSAGKGLASNLQEPGSFYGPAADKDQKIGYNKGHVPAPADQIGFYCKRNDAKACCAQVRH
jgi:formylglycine-generating enzyme required for sulfatase activity